MQSEDRVIDLLRAYVKAEAPSDLWQVVSSDIASVLRKIIAVSAECQRAKLELHELKEHLKRIDEKFLLQSHMRKDTVPMLTNSAENVDANVTADQPRDPDGVFLAPGRTARLAGVVNRPFLHWCKVCNELSRSKHADPANCPRRECRSARWRRGIPGKDSRQGLKAPAKT